MLSNLLSCCNQVKMSIETIKVTRFGGKSSFSAFKHKVLAYLQTIGLKDIVVSGTETRGASSSSSSSGSSGKRSGEEYEEDEPPRVSSKSSGISSSGSSKDTVVNDIS